MHIPIDNIWKKICKHKSSLDMFLIYRMFYFLQNSLCLSIKRGYMTGSVAALPIYPTAFKKASKQLSAIETITL